ncbi:MAG: dolichyl-phosphate beta-glucosyltransferase [Verrucomicrobiota bacterium]|nr:dolichyl-phosphate beta-glucosyltransferase [Verrucomicrobiota bacterium]
MLMSIVIPAFNEAKRISESLCALESFAKKSKNKISLEVIVVCDGCTDNTEKVVQNSSFAKNNLLHVISYKENKGKGYATKEGILSSSGEIVGFMDADASTDISELHSVYEYLFKNKVDIFIGSRRMPNSELHPQQPLYRRCLGELFSLVTRLLLGIPCKDTQCGFKFFRGDLGRSLFTKMQTKGFAFDVEILHNAFLQGYEIKEHGVKWHNNSDSRVSPFIDGFRMLQSISSLSINTLYLRIRNLNILKGRKGVL